MSRASATMGIFIMASLLEPGEWARARPVPTADTTVAIASGFDRLPLRFERSEDQATEPVRYLSRGPGYTMLVTPTEMVLSLRAAEKSGRSVGTRLRVKLLGGRRDADIEALEELPGRSNYLIGSDPKKWRRGVRGYAKVRCRSVYPGIDLVYYGTQGQVEYDFVVAPEADPGRIRLGFEGAGGLRLDGEGNLVVWLDGGEVVKRAPRVYQEAGSRKQPVRGRWLLRGKNEAAFEVGAYDRRLALVIDPVLSYSTCLGGRYERDYGYGIAVDGAGSAYVTGTTLSPDFPTQNPYETHPPLDDVFVTKLSPAGNSLVYSTVLGGRSYDWGRAIALDGAGSAYVTGYTASTDFPTQNPYQTCGGDAFVAKLSPSGDSLQYSTCLGGNGSDSGEGIAVDGLGSAYVTGVTRSTDFPTQNPYQTDQPLDDVFVTKLSPSGSSLVYSTYLGGSREEEGQAIAVDGSGSAYLTGWTLSTNFPTQNPHQTSQGGEDVFVTRLSPSGDELLYSTYLGGNSSDLGSGIALDSSGNAYVTGWTYSTNFPTEVPYQTDQPADDAFVTKLSPSGDFLFYSTYLGGNGFDMGYAIAVDGSGSAYVTGLTSSTNFPTEAPYQTDQRSLDAFVTKLSPSGSSIVYSTYLGGSYDDYGQGIAVDSLGSAYVTGYAASEDFPTQNPYQAFTGTYDVFVTKLALPSVLSLYTVSPCRLIDTRNAAGPHGGPALAAGTDRSFRLAGQCGISATARAVAVNVAVTQATAAGSLRLSPAGGTLPQTSSISYAAGPTRANNAIVSLNTSGALVVRCTQPSGTAHFILDVNGYFE